MIRTAGLSESHVDVSLWFVFEASTGATITADEREFAGVRWWPIDEIRHDRGVRFDPHLPRFLGKFRRLVADRP